MSLEIRLKHLLDKVHTLAMPGFSEFSKNLPAPHGGPNTAHAELSLLGKEIRRAAHQGNEANFDLYEKHYSKIFKSVNEDMATIMFWKKVNSAMDLGVPERDAQLGALTELRNDPNTGRKFIYWFPQPLYARITVSQDITGYRRSGTYYG